MLKNTMTVAAASALALSAHVGAAQADVSAEHARKTWDTSRCGANPIAERLRIGDFTGDGRKDAVMLWECNSGAGGAQMHYLTYWIDGAKIHQKILDTPLPQAGRLSIKGGKVFVIGGDYSGIGVPLCCPDVEVRLTYKWDGRKLVLAKRQDR